MRNIFAGLLLASTLVPAVAAERLVLPRYQEESPDVLRQDDPAEGISLFCHAGRIQMTSVMVREIQASWIIANAYLVIANQTISLDKLQIARNIKTNAPLNVTLTFTYQLPDDVVGMIRQAERMAYAVTPGFAIAEPLWLAVGIPHDQMNAFLAGCRPAK